MTITEADVRRIALSLPGAYEHQSHGGRPSWRTKPRMFAWLRDGPEALVVWVDSLDAKEAMLACEPRTFFTTPHYDGYPIVRVRLEAIDVATATALITESWRCRAPAALVRSADAAPAGAPAHPPAKKRPPKRRR